MFEFFIAKRYLTGKHKFSFIRILSFFSILGITIGVAALVIVLSVFNGFRSLVINSLLNFDPHIQITLPKGAEKLPEINKILKEKDEVDYFTPYVDGKIVITNGKNFEIISLKGLQNYEGKKKQIHRHFVSKLSNSEEKLSNGILLGLPLALKLGLRVGDTVNVLSAKDLEKSAITFNLPRIRKFILEGIFEINNKELAFSSGFTKLEAAQKVLGVRNKINGLEVFLHSVKEADNFKIALKKELGDNVKIFSWYDLHRDLYDVMQLERWAAYLLLSLIILVAVFNILTSLTMSVLEKKKDIAILRAMGTHKKSILRIFMFEGILAGTVGTLSGLFIGLIVCFGQMQFKFYALDPSKYIIDALPVEPKLFDILLIAIMSMLFSYFASLYPAKRSLKLNLIESIKWE